MLSTYEGRIKDAPWFEKSRNEKIMIGGCGGIGSNALYCLGKTIPAMYFIFDPDTVSTENIGTQFFRTSQVGSTKVSAIRGTLADFGVNQYAINNFNNKISESDVLPISIAAFDNMDARKLLFNSWKKLSNREIYIDARLRANLYEVYAVQKGMEAEYEKTLFNDEDADSGPCTFKQTAYFGMLCGARITHVLVNYLTNKYAEEPVCNIPFKIQEVGEPFFIKMENIKNEVPAEV